MSVENLAPTPEKTVRSEIHYLLKEHKRGFTSKRIHQLIDGECSREHISNTLRKMATEGLVTIEKDPTDSRRYIYKGAEKLRNIPSYAAHPVNVYFNAGYVVISHHHKGEQFRVPVHRLVAVAEYGIDEVVDNHVHHKNKHGFDNRPENLCVMNDNLHKKADLISTLKLSTSESEFERLLELADECEAGG